MADLPTTDTTQSFGRRSIDFYAAAGDVAEPDTRARSSERKLRDLDGTDHDVRLSSQGFRFEPGDRAAILRVHAGSSRKSIPVAIINYEDRSWSRLRPEANPLLAKSGVARSMNWALSLLALFAAMFMAVWPALRTFLVEVFPGAFRATPELDIFALAVQAFPDLAGLNLAQNPPGLITQVMPGLSGLESYIWFGLAVLAGGAMAYAVRSWRLLWLPLLIGAIGLGAIALNGQDNAVIPSIIALFVIAVIFAIGGAVNRARDAVRLENRISMLATHLLDNPPSESVRSLGLAPTEESLQAGNSEESDTAFEASENAAINPDADDVVETSATETQVDESHSELASEDSQETSDANERSDDVVTAESVSDNDVSTSHDDQADEPSSEMQNESNAGQSDGTEAVDAEQGVVNVDTVQTTEPSGELSGEMAGTQELDDDLTEDDDPMVARPGKNDDDPRLQSRDISLPPPPPMPGANS